VQGSDGIWRSSKKAVANYKRTKHRRRPRVLEGPVGLQAEAEVLASDGEDRAEAARVLRDMAEMRPRESDSGRP
jgi:hypothetical protein